MVELKRAERRASQNEQNVLPGTKKQFIQVNKKHDPLNVPRWKFCDTSNWNSTTVLSLSVAFIHIGGTAFIALNSNRLTAICFAVIASAFSILLCYGVIWSKNDTLIKLSAFYGMLFFAFMPHPFPELKVNKT